MGTNFQRRKAFFDPRQRQLIHAACGATPDPGDKRACAQLAIMRILHYEFKNEALPENKGIVMLAGVPVHAFVTDTGAAHLAANDHLAPGDLQ